MVKVLLVDGVGNGAVYQRLRDCLTIVLANETFEKTEEFKDGLEVYRQLACGRPRIRHVNKHVATDAAS